MDELHQESDYDKFKNGLKHYYSLDMSYSDLPQLHVSVV